MLEQSVLADLDPEVLAALKERERDYDAFNKQQDDPPPVAAQPDTNKYNFFDEDDFVKPPPPTQNYMGEDAGEEDPVLDELNRNAYFEKDRFDGRLPSKDGDELRSERSLALSNKSEEDTMEKRRNYVVEIIELAEELNCARRLPDEMTMMAMPFKRLITMWHLYDERVNRSTVMRMVRNAFAIVCIAAGRGVEYFLKRVLNKSFMDWSVWQNSFYAKVTTERLEPGGGIHRPPFDRALQRVLNRFSSVKDLMSGEGSLVVMTCVHVFKEYRRQEDARKAEEDKLEALKKEMRMEQKANLKAQVKEALLEERRNYPVPPSPSPSVGSQSVAAKSVRSAPDFDTQSMLSGHSWDENEEAAQPDPEEEVEAHSPNSPAIIAEEVQSNEVIPSDVQAIQEISEEPETRSPTPPRASPLTAPFHPMNGHISDPMDMNANMDELDELASQATSRTQQSGRKKRNKKEIVPDLVL